MFSGLISQDGGFYMGSRTSGRLFGEAPASIDELAFVFLSGDWVNSKFASETFYCRDRGDYEPSAAFDPVV